MFIWLWYFGKTSCSEGKQAGKSVILAEAGFHSHIIHIPLKESILKKVNMQNGKAQSPTHAFIRHIFDKTLLIVTYSIYLYVSSKFRKQNWLHIIARSIDQVSKTLYSFLRYPISIVFMSRNIYAPWATNVCFKPRATAKFKV